MNCRQRDEYEAINVSVIRRLRTLILFALLLFTIAFPSYQASAVNFESNGNGLYVHPKRVKPNNNYAWTTDPGVQGFEDNKKNVVIENALKHYYSGLQQGYHYYAGTPEEIYIGEWENKVGSQTHACIHGKDGETHLPFQDGSGYIGSQAYDALKNGHCTEEFPHICERQYNLPYWAHCSDCGGAILANVYAKASTLQNIKKVPNGSYYYYLCPYSMVNYTRGHMEQGIPFTHQCPKMQSVNRYKVRFNTNFDTGTESSGISVTEKWFYYTDSTSSVTYEGASIAFNSEASFPSSVSWTCKGYVFAGWKTGDGTVVKNYEE